MLLLNTHIYHSQRDLVNRLTYLITFIHRERNYDLF